MDGGGDHPNPALRITNYIGARFERTELRRSVVNPPITPRRRAKRARCGAGRGGEGEGPRTGQFNQLRKDRDEGTAGSFPLPTSPLLPPKSNDPKRSSGADIVRGRGNGHPNPDDRQHSTQRINKH
jgi:hypothetical protein